MSMLSHSGGHHHQGNTQAHLHIRTVSWVVLGCAAFWAVLAFALIH